MPNENPGLDRASARARTSVLHGLRKSPAMLSVQGLGYNGKRTGQMSLASTLDGALIWPSLEGAPSKVGVGSGQCGVANTVTFPGGVASSGEIQRSSAYGHETRSAFPYESKRASFDSKRQSVHVALENYGLNCPVPVPPSPMRSKSALGRDHISRTPKPLLFSSHDGQVDSLFDHDAEQFETTVEKGYQYLNDEDASSSDVLTDSFLDKSQRQVDVLGETIKAEINFRSELFDTCDNEGVAAIGSIQEISKADVQEAESLVQKLKVTAHWPDGKASRGVFCSRTLNLRCIDTIGYDMDYTLIHYNMNAWEGKAYDYGISQLNKMGYPTDGLKFDSCLIGSICGSMVNARRSGFCNMKPPSFYNLRVDKVKAKIIIKVKPRFWLNQV